MVELKGNFSIGLFDPATGKEIVDKNYSRHHLCEVKAMWTSPGYIEVFFYPEVKFTPHKSGYYQGALLEGETKVHIWETNWISKGDGILFSCKQICPPCERVI